MSDQYPRVTRLLPGTFGYTDDRYLVDDADGRMKVVPADAIVTERGDVPEVEDHRVDEFYVDGFVFSRNKDVSELRDEALVRLALIEYLTAHPSIDEAQVEALAHDLLSADQAHDRGIRTLAEYKPKARRLVEQGWAKPEVSK